MKTASSFSIVVVIVAATVGGGRNHDGRHSSRGDKRGSLFVAGFLPPLDAGSTWRRTIARSARSTTSSPRSCPYEIEAIGLCGHRRKRCQHRNSWSTGHGLHWVSAGALFVGVTPEEMDAEWARILEEDDDEEEEEEDDDEDDEDEGDGEEEEDDSVDDEFDGDDDDDFDEWELPTSGPGKEDAEAFESEIDRVLRGEDREDYDYGEAMLDLDNEDECVEEDREGEAKKMTEAPKGDQSLRVSLQDVEGRDGPDGTYAANEVEVEDEDDEDDASKDDEELLLGFDLKKAYYDSPELEEDDEDSLDTPPRPPRKRYGEYLKEKRAKEAAWEKKRKTFSAAHNAYLDEAQRNREAAAARKELYAKKFVKRKTIYNYVVEKEKQAEREATWACRWPRNVTRPMESLREGEWLEGKVRNVESYGAWVDVGVERDGLLHVRDMSERFTQRASDAVATRDKISVRVKHVDPAVGKLGLSLVKDDASVAEELPRPPARPSIKLAEVSPGTELWGFVERVTNLGAYVNVGAEVEGFLHIREVPGRQKGLDAQQILRKHKRLRVYAKEIDVAGKRIKLSCRRPKSKPRCGPPLALTSLDLADEFVYDDAIYAGDDDPGDEGEVLGWGEEDGDESEIEEDVDWFYEDREPPTDPTLYTVE